jgi:hypothetical protein
VTSPLRIRWLLSAAVALAGGVHAQTESGMTDPDSAKHSGKPTNQAARIIVTYRDGPTSESATAANQAIGVRVVRTLATGHAVLVELPAGMSLDEGLDRLRAQPGVRHAEPDSLRRVTPIPGPKVEP